MIEVLNVCSLMPVESDSEFLMEYNYRKAWKQQEEHPKQKEYRRRTMFQAFIPDKEYGDYWT